MRTKKRFVVIALLLSLSMMSFDGTITKAKDYTNLGCVNWVKDRANEKLGITLPPTGMNEFGLYGASAYWTNLSGYKKGSEPAANSLAVWKYNNGLDGQSGRYGHVAFVESVNGNKVTTTEGGCPGYSYNGHTGVICRTQDKSRMSTLGGCSELLGYIYLSGGTAGITFGDQKVVSTSNTNAVVYTKINNPGRQSFSSVGCHLYNVNDQLVKSYSEICTLSTSYVNYNCDFNADMKITLTQGTTYKYVLYCMVGGKEYKDSVRIFNTTGPTPSVASVAFKNQRINSVSETNAEVYVYIDNPGKLVVERVGCNLYDPNGNIVKTYSENCGLSTSYVNYVCNFNLDAKCSLQPNTTYKYELYAVVGGKEYKDALKSFTTLVQANVAPTASPENMSSPLPDSESVIVGVKDINRVIAWALNIAEDDSHGYSQSIERRWGTPDYDCSSFVISAFKSEGFDVSNAVNTKNIRSVFENAGFVWIPRGSIELANSSHLLVGDILLDEGVHTEIYTGSGMMVGAHGGSFSIYDENNPGDDNGEEISTVSYSDKNWDGILRYVPSNSGNVTPAPTIKPTPTVKPTQIPAVSKTPTPTNPVAQTPTPRASESPSEQKTVGSFLYNISRAGG